MAINSIDTVRKNVFKRFLNRVKEAVKYLNKMILLKVVFISFGIHIFIENSYVLCKFEIEMAMPIAVRNVCVRTMVLVRNVYNKRYDNFNSVSFK